MKSSRIRSLINLLAVILLVVGCYVVASSGNDSTDRNVPIDTYVPTSTRGSTPTPPLINFDTICQTGEKIRVEGFLQLPDSVGCVTEEDAEYCTVQLADFVTGNAIILSLPVEDERENLTPNHMLGLPISYEVADFMVSTDDSQKVGEGSIVRVTGLAELFDYPPSKGYACRLAEISKIEKIERFSLVDEQTRQTTLRAAVKEGWVEIVITGDGLSQIDLKIEPKVNFNLDIEVEVGTIFLSDAAGVQNMVVRQQSFVYVTPEMEAEIELEVSCANMKKKEPGNKNIFTVQPELAPQDLINLINLAEFAFEPMRIQQFSIWTVIDNPSRNGFVGITTNFSSEGGPTAGELARIKELFLQAGLDVAEFKALKDS